MLDIKRVLIPDIKEFIKEKELEELKDFLKHLKPQDIADLLSLEEFSHAEKALLFRLLDKHEAAIVFSELYFEDQQKLLKYLSSNETITLLEDMDPDDRALLFDELPPEVVKQLLLKLSPEEREHTLTLLNYPPDSVGRAMTPDVLNVQEDMTVDEVIQKIRAVSEEVETIYDIYVLDKDEKLIGKVDLKSLVLSKGDVKIKEIMEKNPVYVRAQDDREKAANLIKKYDLISIPVVDSENKLLGIITVDDVLDIMEQEATEDIYKMAAVEAPEIEEEYLRLSPLERVKKRIPWLLGLLVAEVASSSVLKGFDETLSAVVSLAFFIPMLTDTGGNVGSQAVTLIVRALATGEFNEKKIGKVIIHEILTSFVLGLPLAIVGFIIAQLVSNSIHVAIIVSLSLFLVIVLSDTIGLLLPLLFRIIKIDPAVSSSPLITTVVDITGLLTYFTLATLLLKNN